MLATDGSDGSEGAARFLTSLNLTEADEVAVVHVIGWVPFKDDWETHFAAIKQIKQEVAPRILDSCVSILSPLKARISTSVLEGYPDKSLVDLSEDSNADLVVMGARGLKGIKSFFIGSVTRSVAAYSSRPSLIIKPPQWKPKDTLRILLSTDGSHYAESAIKLLSSMPFPSHAELYILNVIWPAMADIPERFVMEINDRIKDTVARARTAEYAASEKTIETAYERLKDKFGKVTRISKVGDPSEAILTTTE